MTDRIVEIITEDKSSEPTTEFVHVTIDNKQTLEQTPEQPIGNISNWFARNCCCILTAIIFLAVIGYLAGIFVCMNVCRENVVTLLICMFVTVFVAMGCAYGCEANRYAH